MPVDLMPHQRKALGEIKNGCILKGPVGAGKTLVALSYFDDNETIERLIVITTAKKRDTGDWQAEARPLGIFPQVDSWQNLSNYKDIENAFFIFDEQRLVGSGEWVKSFLKITKKNQWILLSATPGDTWMDYIPVFVANGFYKNRLDFLREHVVFAPFVKYPKVERFISTSRLARHLRDILVEMPYEKHTIRHEKEIFVEYDRERYDLAWKNRWNYLEQRPIRHVSELFSLMRRVVNSSPSRLERIREVLTKHPRVIIFYNFDYELEILRGLTPEPDWPPWETGPTGEDSGSSTATAEGTGTTSTPSSYALAEWNGHKHQPIPETERWVYLVQYNSGAEGWNCTETDTVVFYSLTYSYRSFEQAKGRIDRLDTPFTDLWYYILVSPSLLDMAIVTSLARKESFNETKWLKTAFLPSLRHRSDILVTGRFRRSAAPFVTSSLSLLSNSKYIIIHIYTQEKPTAKKVTEVTGI